MPSTPPASVPRRRRGSAVAALAGAASRGALLALALLALVVQLAVVAAGPVDPAFVAGAALLSTVPAALFAVWFVDRSEATPGLGGAALVAAAAATAAMLPAVVTPLLPFVVGTGGVLRAVAVYAVAVPLVEEGVKLGATRYGDADVDGDLGLALGAIAGLGFTVTENLLAVAGAGFVGGDPGAAALSRVPLASLHVVTGAAAGHLLYTSGRRGGYASAAVALLAAATVHGAYNLLAWSELAAALPVAGEVPLATGFLLIVVLVAYLATADLGDRSDRPPVTLADEPV